MMLETIKTFLFKNKALKQTVIKNTFWIAVGQILSRIFRAILVIYSARILGVNSWGIFSYIISIATFLTIFSDLGVNAFVTKELAKNTEATSEEKKAVFSNAISLKIILIAILSIAIFILSPVIAKLEGAEGLFIFIILIFGFDAIRDLGAALARGMEKMETEALLNSFTNFAILLFGVIFLAYQTNAISLSSAYTIGTFLGLVFAIYVLRSRIKNLLCFGLVKISLLLKILKESWSFGLISILGIIMINTDVIMLGWLKSSYEVGLYSAAQKIIQLLYFIPAFLASGLFPAFSRLAIENREKFIDMLMAGLKICLALAIAILIIGIVFSGQLIKLLFGEDYLGATNVFKILLLTIIIVFPSVILTNAFFAQNERRKFVEYFALGALGNVIANLLLIPKFGIEGCAIATIISQILSGSIYLFKVRADFKFSFLKIIGAPLVVGALIAIFTIGSSLAISILNLPQEIALSLSALLALIALFIFVKKIISPIH